MLTNRRSGRIMCGHYPADCWWHETSWAHTGQRNPPSICMQILSKKNQLAWLWAVRQLRPFYQDFLGRVQCCHGPFLHDKDLMFDTCPFMKRSFIEQTIWLTHFRWRYASSASMSWFGLQYLTCTWLVWDKTCCAWSALMSWFQEMTVPMVLHCILYCMELDRRELIV